MTIGVLSLQGDFAAHEAMLATCTPAVPLHIVAVREAGQLEQCDGLVIPGGESTTMSRLCDRYDLWDPIKRRMAEGMGAFGTCAGLIMLARTIAGATTNFSQRTLDVLDVDVSRNAYGSQIDSFEATVQGQGPLSGRELRVAFIRAPRITRCGAVEVLATWAGEPVAVLQGTVMGTAFHPEIAAESRFHRCWIQALLADRRGVV